MMKEIFLSVINDLVLYNNNRFLIPLFVIALVYIWKTETDRSVRSILACASTGLILVFICPVYAYVGNKVDKEIYYRVWWCIPMGVTICYAAVKLAFRFKSMGKRLLIGVIVLAIVVLNGKFVYTNTTRVKAENGKHLPQFVVDVADAVTMEYDTPNCVFPLEIAIYVRQYNAKITEPYSRFNFTDAGMDSKLYDLMTADSYDVASICEAAKVENALYVVFNSVIAKTDSMENYGYTYLGLVDGYEIYRYEQLYLDYIEYGAIKK